MKKMFDELLFSFPSVTRLGCHGFCLRHRASSQNKRVSFEICHPHIQIPASSFAFSLLQHHPYTSEQLDAQIKVCSPLLDSEANAITAVGRCRLEGHQTLKTVDG